MRNIKTMRRWLIGMAVFKSAVIGINANACPEACRLLSPSDAASIGSIFFTGDGPQSQDSFVVSPGAPLGRLEFELAALTNGSKYFLELHPDNVFNSVSLSFRVFADEGDGIVSIADYPRQGLFGTFQWSELSNCVPIRVEVTSAIVAARSVGINFVRFAVESTGGSFAIWGPGHGGNAFDNIFLAASEPFIESNCLLPLAIVASSPPFGTIDGKQDFDDQVDFQGTKSIGMRFSCAVQDLASSSDPSANSFVTHDSFGFPPFLLTALPTTFLECGALQGPIAFRLSYEYPFIPGTWTRVRSNVKSVTGGGFETNQASVLLGYLPGDLSHNGTADIDDILMLIASLNSANETIEIDVNRSGIVGADDLIRLIDLLNGVNTSMAWLNYTLPAPPL